VADPFGSPLLRPVDIRIIPLREAKSELLVWVLRLARGQVAILGGALLEMGQLVAEDDLAFVDHEQCEYAEGDPAARDLLGFGTVDADDARALRNGRLERDLDVLERALEFANVSDESRKIERAPVSLLDVPGAEIAGNRAFIERVGREHVTKRLFDQGFVEFFLAGGPCARAFLFVNAHGGMISPRCAVPLVRQHNSLNEGWGTRLGFNTSSKTGARWRKCRSRFRRAPLERKYANCPHAAEAWDRP
jgi:hypothetical protein